MHHRRVSARVLVALAGLVLPLGVAVPIAATTQSAAPAEITYWVRVTAPEHHWMEIAATFPDLPPGPLELRMSRSSPGRYALHEFAKNVFELRAEDDEGEPLEVTRPDPYGWTVPRHGGQVTVRYRIFGDRADGTYLQVDTSHAHINGPATFVWARGLQSRPVRVRLVPPEGEDWTVATQLFPGARPLDRTAPNLRYLMDSPIEFGETVLYSFPVADGNGEQTIRVALHHQGSVDEAREYVGHVRDIVEETAGIFGEYPSFDGGTYTFLADYLPWASGDGMEHRNSTVLTSNGSLATAGTRLLGTVAHEFFHAWNVERIRPASLEPFDFEHANMSSELWLAEGFTSYYGNLVMHRAGIAPLAQLLGTLGRTVEATRTSPGTRFRSAVEMSRLAPFVDAARPVDRTYWDNTFLSYYTYGAALALGLDLSLRERTGGRVSLDHFMRTMWARHGRPRGPEPPTVPEPYTIADARAVLGEVSGDAEFARRFFADHIEGTEPVDYVSLLERAGVSVQPVAGDAAWLGVSVGAGEDGPVVTAPTLFGSPAYDAGLDAGDTLLSVDGEAVPDASALAALLDAHEPGDRVIVRLRRRDGSEQETLVTLGRAPGIRLVPVEQTGMRLSAEQADFRDGWLHSRRLGR